MKVLLIDDEEPARMELRRLLSVYGDVAVVGEAATVRDALALTESLRPDVAFLDIQLVGESGFDYVAHVSEGAPHIVFITAYDRHAVRAFECNALDYLLKPVRSERLAETLHRIDSRKARVSPRFADEEDAVFIKADAVARFVSWRTIQHVTSNGNYTIVHLADGTRLIVRRPLKQWLALAPKGAFLQVHRASMVRRNAIRELLFSEGKKRNLLLCDGSLVPVGREYASAVYASLTGNRCGHPSDFA